MSDVVVWVMICNETIWLHVTKPHIILELGVRLDRNISDVLRRNAGILLMAERPLRWLVVMAISLMLYNWQFTVRSKATAKKATTLKKLVIHGSSAYKSTHISA